MAIKYIKTPEALALETSYAMNSIDLDFAPRRATKGSSGYDLSACIPHAVSIFPNETAKIPTGVRIWLDSYSTYPENAEQSGVFAGLYLPRSSVKGLVLENTIGLLDDDYQGESFIKFFNRGDDVVTISPGQRIAQLVIVFTCIEDMECVESFGSETTRGNGGFGSTGA